MSQNKEGITVKKNENFSEWYTQVVQKCELADLRYNVKGFIIFQPWSVLSMEKMYKFMEGSLQQKGHKPYWFPTVIPKGNFEISKAKIRGIESNGMICSEDELLLSDDHEGIIVLDSKLKPGTKVTKALGLDDVILEIGITPNRPDALSHIGVARDLAALFNRKLVLPKIKLNESKERISC